MAKIDGVVPIVPIPFKDDESIDESSLVNAVEFVCARKLAGIGLPAYGSEFYKLSEGERDQVVGITIEASKKRVPVVAQANHGSSRIASETARRYEKMGADLIAFAIPRQFGTSAPDLVRYCGRICDAVSVPVVIQDFNPGGQTMDAEFMATLHAQHPNFQYAKLEEPLIVDKLKSIRDTLGDAVGILEGWGGYYMLEAIPVGICGIMPGVPIADLLNRVYWSRREGRDDQAYDLLGSLLPFINFTLQDMELFLQVEKRLMVRRGIFENASVRSLTLSPSPVVEKHIVFLNSQIMRILERERLPVGIT